MSLPIVLAWLATFHITCPLAPADPAESGLVAPLAAPLALAYVSTDTGTIERTWDLEGALWANIEYDSRLIAINYATASGRVRSRLSLARRDLSEIPDACFRDTLLDDTGRIVGMTFGAQVSEIESGQGNSFQFLDGSLLIAATGSAIPSVNARQECALYDLDDLRVIRRMTLTGYMAYRYFREYGAFFLHVDAAGPVLRGFHIGSPDDPDGHVEIRPAGLSTSDMMACAATRDTVAVCGSGIIRLYGMSGIQEGTLRYRGDGMRAALELELEMQGDRIFVYEGGVLTCLTREGEIWSRNLGSRQQLLRKLRRIR